MNLPQKFLAGAAAAALAAGMAAAQSQSKSANRLAADNTFVTKAAEGGMAEVEMGQLAVQHASNNMVKQFGQKMVDDHSKANDQLKKIAAQEGITLPSTVSAKEQAEMDRLSKLNGAAFDRAYMQEMVKDHRQDVAEFKKEANSGDNPQVKAFAAQTLPTLEEHLRLAEKTEKEVNK